jgi:ribosomal protein S18 acetylase RimI-like enzyme
MGSATLRPSTGADAELVVSWVPDSAALYFLTGPRLSWPVTSEALLMLQGGTAGLTAWALVDPGSPGAPIGHVDITVENDRASLSRVIVDPARRGEGLGRQLLLLAIAKAHELGASVVDLNVIEGNNTAIQLYLSLGFTVNVESIRPDVVSMTLLDSAPAGEVPLRISE